MFCQLITHQKLFTESKKNPGVLFGHFKYTSCPDVQVVTIKMFYSAFVLCEACFQHLIGNNQFNLSTPGDKPSTEPQSTDKVKSVPKVSSWDLLPEFKHRQSTTGALIITIKMFLHRMKYIWLTCILGNSDILHNSNS